MYVIVNIPLKSPSLYFPPAGGKLHTSDNEKALKVFLAPFGGKMSVRTEWGFLYHIYIEGLYGFTEFKVNRKLLGY